MGGQGIDRREALRVLALASAAGQFSGFSRWVFGGAAHSTSTLASREYRLQFFTEAEYRVVERTCELIIPSDGTPGAREAGVSEFVDFMASVDRKLQVPLRDGLNWVEARCRILYGTGFVKLDRERQEEFFTHLAYAERFRPGEEQGRQWFRLMRDYAVMGFYSSKIGMEELDCPALQTSYAQPPGCPHDDDREHRRLREGRAEA